MKPALSYDALRQVVAEQQAEIIAFQALPLVERDKMHEMLVLCKLSFCTLGYVKASGLSDRKASCIELILRALRSLNRESFHVSLKCKN